MSSEWYEFFRRKEALGAISRMRFPEGTTWFLQPTVASGRKEIRAMRGIVSCCPLTAWASVDLGQNLHQSFFKDAAAFLCVDPDTRNIIRGATDDSFYADQYIRAALLRKCGLDNQGDTE